MTDVSSVGIQLHQSNSDSKRLATTLQSIFSLIDVINEELSIVLHLHLVLYGMPVHAFC